MLKLQAHLPSTENLYFHFNTPHMCRSMLYMVGEECWNIKPVLLEMIVVGYDSFQLSGLLFYGFSFTFLFGRTFYSPSRFCYLLAINTIFFYPIKEIVAYLMCFVIDNLSTCHFVTELNFLFIISQIYHFDLKI